MQTRFARNFVVMASTSALAACTHLNRPSPGPKSTGPSDGNIVAIVMASSNADLSYARLALARTTSPAVKDFAARMITDHSAINAALAELVSRSTIKPADNDGSLAYRDESARERDRIRSLEGRDFDTAYIANEIRFDRKLIQVLDDELIPKVRDTQLRRVLVSVRPAVAAHLEHATKLKTGDSGAERWERVESPGAGRRG